jgi:hypothetical protein
MLPQMARRWMIFLFPAAVPDSEGKNVGRLSGPARQAFPGDGAVLGVEFDAEKPAARELRGRAGSTRQVAFKGGIWFRKVRRSTVIDRERICADCSRGFGIFADLSPEPRELPSDPWQKQLALWERLREEHPGG